MEHLQIFFSLILIVKDTCSFVPPGLLYGRSPFPPPPPPSQPAASVPRNRARKTPFPPPWRNYLKNSRYQSLHPHPVTSRSFPCAQEQRRQLQQVGSCRYQEQGPSPSSHIEPAAPPYLSIQGAFLFLLLATQAPSLLLLSVRSTGLITYMHKRQIKKQRETF